jgi:hypothetical protein
VWTQRLKRAAAILIGSGLLVAAAGTSAGEVSGLDPRFYLEQLRAWIHANPPASQPSVASAAFALSALATPGITSPAKAAKEGAYRSCPYSWSSNQE